MELTVGGTGSAALALGGLGIFLLSILLERRTGRLIAVPCE